jgi:small subunit ribosomal protein S16
VVKIRLKRIGKKREPYFRIVVTDSRAKRDGRVIEEIGKYYPKANPSEMEVVSDRVQYWLSVGAVPSSACLKILEILGEWAKFRGSEAKSHFKTAPPQPSVEKLIQEVADQAEQIKADARKQAVAAAKAEKAEKSAQAEVKATENDVEGSETATTSEAPEIETAETAETATVSDTKTVETSEVSETPVTAETPEPVSETQKTPESEMTESDQPTETT